MFKEYFFPEPRPPLVPSAIIFYSKMMFVSVIIPTYNEEQYLPRLLRALKNQTYPDFEVIVADAFSTDRSREIAETYASSVVDGGLPGAGRNRGAEAAKGDFYFFFDSDVIIPSTFLERAIVEIQEKSIQLAGCEARPLSTRLLDKVLHKFAFVGMKLTKESNPRLPGYCILISREIFEKLGGFDESIRVGEDLNLVARAAEQTPLHLLESTDLQIRVRRYDKEGRLPYLRKSLRVYFYRKYKGEIKDEKDISYEFGNFEKEDDSKDFDHLLRRIQERLEYLEKRIAKIQKRKGSLPEDIMTNFQNIADTLDSLLSHEEEEETDNYTES